jgi:Hypervirulence associated proteins TUDOR domain
MAKQLKPGDRVQWNTPQGKTTGKVKNKLTSSKKIKSHVAERESRVSGSKREIRQTSRPSAKRAW